MVPIRGKLPDRFALYRPGFLGDEGTWFGFYAYIQWREMLDWYPGSNGQ